MNIIKNTFFILLIILLLIFIFKYTKNIETFNRCRIKSVDIASDLSSKNNENVFIQSIETLTNDFFMRFFKFCNNPLENKYINHDLNKFFCNNSKISYGSNINDSLNNYLNKINKRAVEYSETGQIFPTVTCINNNITKKFIEQYAYKEVPIWFIDNSGCITEGNGQLVGTPLTEWNAKDISGWRECIKECDKRVECYGANTNDLKKCTLIGSDINNPNEPIDVSWNYWKKEDTCKAKSGSFKDNKYFYQNDVSVKLINPSSKETQTMNFYLKYDIRNSKPCIIEFIDKDNKLANDNNYYGFREVNCPDGYIFDNDDNRCRYKDPYMRDLEASI